MNVHPQRFASDASDLYVSTDTGVMHCASTGCKSLDPFYSGASSTFLALDTNNLYIATVDGRVLECSRSSCASPKELASGQGTIGSISLDATHVYWTATDLGLVQRIVK